MQGFLAEVTNRLLGHPAEGLWKYEALPNCAMLTFERFECRRDGVAVACYSPDAATHDLLRPKVGHPDATADGTVVAAAALADTRAIGPLVFPL